MGTAKEIKQLEDWRGYAKLYEVDPPIGYNYNYETEQFEDTTPFVVVSAVVVPLSGPETYIFPANADGSTINMLELEGSRRSILNHKLALEAAGY